MRTNGQPHRHGGRSKCNNKEKHKPFLLWITNTPRWAICLDYLLGYLLRCSRNCLISQTVVPSFVTQATLLFIIDSVQFDYKCYKFESLRSAGAAESSLHCSLNLMPVSASKFDFYSLSFLLLVFFFFLFLFFFFFSSSSFFSPLPPPHSSPSHPPSSYSLHCLYTITDPLFPPIKWTRLSWPNLIDTQAEFFSSFQTEITNRCLLLVFFFCFNVPYHFHHFLIYKLSLSLLGSPVGFFPFIYVFFSLREYSSWFTPTISRTQLRRKKKVFVYLV